MGVFKRRTGQPESPEPDPVPGGGPVRGAAPAPGPTSPPPPAAAASTVPAWGAAAAALGAAGPAFVPQPAAALDFALIAVPPIQPPAVHKAPPLEEAPPKRGPGEKEERRIFPVKYGMPARETFRTDRSYPDPGLDSLIAVADRGDWRTVKTALDSVRGNWERHYQLSNALAHRDPAKVDPWLTPWLRAAPNDPTALAMQANYLTKSAWTARTAERAHKVSREQFAVFFQLLNQAAPLCQRSATLDPYDPTPLIELLTIAMGLQWDNTNFRALFAQVEARSPHHSMAVSAAGNYWQPRWFGSMDLLNAFFDEQRAKAPVGSLIEEKRLSYTVNNFDEIPEDERKAYRTGPEVSALLDHAVADFEAADPRHPGKMKAAHLIAQRLTIHGRYAEAVRMFRRIGAFAGNTPWTWAKDPVQSFTQRRTDAILGWEDAGRPPLPNGEMP